MVHMLLILIFFEIKMYVILLIFDILYLHNETITKNSD